jgi:DMSO reductase family type II enzyme chaperone
MTAQTTRTESAAAARRVTGRNRDATAAVRCACYAALSELTASPHDLDPRPSLRDKTGVGDDAASLGNAAGSALDAIIREFAELDLDTLKRAYSGLFEVGDDGPPVPIREDLQTGQRAGTREDLVRFYNFFNYALDEKFAWAPDHLSVELEFMHFLCYREADAEADALPYQLAQFDFAERHLVNWLPVLESGVRGAAPDSLYARVVGVAREFAVADHAWQAGTITRSKQ